MSKHDIIINMPASSFKNKWRDASALGNGYTGALMYGGIRTESIILNRNNLWHIVLKKSESKIIKNNP